MRLLTCLLCSLCLLLAAGCEEQVVRPGLAVTTPKQGDYVVIVCSPEEAILDIYSDIGIGQATITAGSDGWPESMTLRLHLKGLEGLTLWSDQAKLEREELDVVVEEGVPYRSIAVPAELLQAGSPELHVHWIDFYR